TQRSFTKTILSLQQKPQWNSTDTNLERISCSISEQFKFQHTNDAIWSSLRSRPIARLTRNFLWKSVHNIYCVGSFWEQIPNLEILGRCSECHALESMEHILLECQGIGQAGVWQLAENLWRFRDPDWPKIKLGSDFGMRTQQVQELKGENYTIKKQILCSCCPGPNESDLES
ncbi:hypothetical protein DFH08DRAFT_692070, partial [Mycena albidolilacea]